MSLKKVIVSQSNANKIAHMLTLQFEENFGSVVKQNKGFLKIYALKLL